MRIREISSRGELSSEGRTAYDSIVGPRGRLPLPFALLLNRPDLAAAVGTLGEIVRLKSSLPRNLLEVAILATASETGCEYALERHQLHAKAAGVCDETIRCILERRPPADARDATIVEFVRSTLLSHRVSNETYADAQHVVGDLGVLELATTVGYYSLIATVVNTFADGGS